MKFLIRGLIIYKELITYNSYVQILSNFHIFNFCWEMIQKLDSILIFAAIKLNVLLYSNMDFSSTETLKCLYTRIRTKCKKHGLYSTLSLSMYWGVACTLDFHRISPSSLSTCMMIQPECLFIQYSLYPPTPQQRNFLKEEVQGSSSFFAT